MGVVDLSPETNPRPAGWRTRRLLVWKIQNPLRWSWSLLTMLLSMALSAKAESPDTRRFRDVAGAVGVQFSFDNGSRGKHDLPEIMGGGVAVLDVNGDRAPDLYFCNGGPIGEATGRLDPPCRTFLNDGHGRFRDVTGEVSAPGPSYAMGAAVGDFDNDGRDDLFVTGWRDQRLYRNLGGRFEDVTDRAGLASDRWSTSAAFADLDGDGDLDLNVASYAAFDPRRAPYCAAPDGKRDYCGPEDLDPQNDCLYRNNGDGTFTDVSQTAGIALSGRGLGVLIANLTGDDKPDLYVANDGTPCRLFENRGDLQFEDVALDRGVAVDGVGNALAGMGVAFGDIDGDGRGDLCVTNFLGRSTVAFRALGHDSYADQSAALGLTALTRPVLGFGIALADLDNDGRLDLIQANGHVLDRARLGVAMAMPTVLAWNRGGRFVSAAPDPNGPLARRRLGRGIAVGDLDGDGCLEVILSSIDRPAAILKTEPQGTHALILDLHSRSPSRSATGAVVRAKVQGRWMTRHCVAGGSYLSASSSVIHLGLGSAETVEVLEIRWPSGRVERWKDCESGRRALSEGTGEPVP